MRNGQTYYEQVPIEVVETILQTVMRPSAVTVITPEKSRGLVVFRQPRAVAEFPKQKRSGQSKGKL